MYCGWISQIPYSIATNVVANTVVISWTAPYDNGATITSYTITILQKNSVYSEDLTDCDGTQTNIVSSTACIVPLETLYNNPYNLLQGDEIWAKVSATNLYGTSNESTPGNGDVVVFVPDQPINLQDDVPVTSAFVMGLTWDDGPNDGGKPVIDYVISSD